MTLDSFLNHRVMSHCMKANMEVIRSPATLLSSPASRKGAPHSRQHRGSSSDSRGSVLKDEPCGGPWLKIQILPHILLWRGWPARSSSLVFIFLEQRHQVTLGPASFLSSKKELLVAESIVRVSALQVFPAVQKGSKSSLLW